jgi:hypothetical protein
MLDAWSKFEVVQWLFTVGFFACILAGGLFVFLMRRAKQERKFKAQEHVEWKEHCAIVNAEASRHHERELQLDDRKKAIPHFERSA